MHNELKSFLAKNNLSQANLARSIGVTSSAISQWINKLYKGDSLKLEKKIKDFIANYNVKDIDVVKEIVYKTKDMLSALFVMEEAVIGQEFALIYGKAGCGKTTAIREFISTKPNSILIETIPGMTLRSMLKFICEKIGISASTNASEMTINISNEFKKRDSFLIIDEAENLKTNALEAIRRIQDFSKVPVILVGTYNLLTNLQGKNGELSQLRTRILGKWEFTGLTDADWEMVFGKFAKHIKSYTNTLRGGVNIMKKAKRFAFMHKQELSVQHIETASKMVLL